MRSVAAAIPLLIPGVLLSAVIALLIAPRVACALRTRTPVAFLLVMRVGSIVAITLTPHATAIQEGAASDGVCDLSRWTPVPLDEMTRISTVTLNILLFIPLGMALGLLPRRGQTVGLILGAAMFPVIIEGTQLLAPALGRGCESADVVDNMLGLALGLAAGVTGRLLGVGRGAPG
ncbi:hypothetical protein BH24CHL9_BH24CHL9_07070 [soil metagenome]